MRGAAVRRERERERARKGQRSEEKTGRNLVHTKNARRECEHPPARRDVSSWLSHAFPRPTDIFIIRRRSHVVTGLKSLRALAATSKDAPKRKNGGEKKTPGVSCSTLAKP